MARAGQPFEPAMKGSSPSKGDRRSTDRPASSCGSRIEASKKRASPADAFCPEAPCPRATTQAPRKCQTLIAPPDIAGALL